MRRSKYCIIFSCRVIAAQTFQCGYFFCLAVFLLYDKDTGKTIIVTNPRAHILYRFVLNMARAMSNPKIPIDPHALSNLVTGFPVPSVGVCRTSASSCTS